MSNSVLILAVAVVLSVPSAAFGEVLAVSTAAESAPSVGVGAILGDPTALSLKFLLADRHAVQLFAGWGYFDSPGSRLTLMGDYLFHFVSFQPRTASAGSFSPYLGIGGLLGFHSDPRAVAFGPRVPIGLSFLVRDAPVEIFAEVAPGVLVVPYVAAMIQGGIGARFYF